MQQVKIFVGIEQDSDVMEQEMNTWLAENQGVRVVNIFGTIAPQTPNPQNSPRMSINDASGGRRFAPSDLFMCIVYDTDG